MIADLVTVIFLLIALYGIYGMLSVEPDFGERIHPPKEEKEKDCE